MLPWLLLGALNAGVMALRPIHYGTVHTRVLQILYDLGHHAALASLAYGFGVGVIRLPTSRAVWATAALAAMSIVVGCHALAPDLVGLGERIARKQIGWVPYFLAVSASLSVPMAAVIGRTLAKRRLRAAGLVLALVLVACNFRYLRGSHPGVHTFLTLQAAALASAVLLHLELPAGWSSVLHRARRYILVLAAGGAIAVGRAPDAEVRIALARVNTSVLSPMMDIIWKRPELPPVTVPEELRPWFQPRLAGGVVGPSSAVPIAPNPVVILLTVDALRADLFLDAQYAARLPQMTAFRDNSVFFSQARSTAPDTRTSLAAIFTGKLFSELPWTELYASIETYRGPYFPERLTSRGVLTVNFAADYEIASKKRGVVRGFAEERIMLPSPGAKLALAHEVIKAIIARLGEEPERAMFFYSHLGDPHAPYDLGGKGEDDRDSYVREVETVGRAIGELRRALKAPEFADRSVLILSADHGEFFGEHGYYYHGRTVYDDVVRVPLLISAPGIAPRQITAPVSLLDLGPTILDMFGVGWPSDFMGETIRPVIAGDNPWPNRPIPVQSRLDYGLVFSDGHKAMVNWSRNWEEVYNLNTDPDEKLNRRDRDVAAADQRIGLLREYFNAHARTRPDGRKF
jgi:hypothetical protein